MKKFFKDIFEYHHHFNQELADLLSKNSDQITDRSIPLFSHMVNAHQIWNSRILSTPSIELSQVHPLDKIKLIDVANYLETVKILDDYELGNQLKYKNFKGQEFTNTIRDILFHEANHHTHHRGQLISDLRLRGIEPLVTDYIFYKR